MQTTQRRYQVPAMPRRSPLVDIMARIQARETAQQKVSAK